MDQRNQRNAVMVTVTNVKKVAFRKLYQKFISENDPFVIIYGNFAQLRSFYIFPPTSREKESCLCIICLNVHCLYDAKENTFPTSLSSYITSSIKCEDEQKIQFSKFECLTSNFVNKCEIITSDAINDKTVISYY